MMSARVEDNNGYIEVKDNPISKAGVFPYLGRSISNELVPDKMYMVYRPAEELADPECVNSFKLVPIIDDHLMLGPREDGVTPAEEKGVEGSTGEEVYFDATTGHLRSNLKLFSQRLIKKISRLGKKDLSIGYRCKYDLVTGIFNGERYDARQREIRGNHVAVVLEGRSGPDVSVLDNLEEQFIFTLDSAEFSMPYTKDEEEAKKAKDAEEKAVKDAEEEEKKAKDEEEKEKAAKDAEEKEKETKDAEEEEKKTKDADENKKTEDSLRSAMDGMSRELKAIRRELNEVRTSTPQNILNEISKRDQLASQIAKHVGVFDHKEMTLDAVASYGAKKLGLTVKKGEELPVLTGFFLGADKKVPAAFAADSAEKSVETCDELDSYIKGEKK